MENIQSKLNSSKQKIDVLSETLIKVYPIYKLYNTNEYQSQYNNVLKQIDKEMNSLVVSNQFIQDIHKDLNKKIKETNIGLEFSRGIYQELKKKYDSLVNVNDAYIPRETYFEYLRNQQLVGIFANTALFGYLSYMMYVVFTEKV